MNITASYTLTHRSVCLTKVLWFGVPWLRSTFVALVFMWALVGLVDYQSDTIGLVAAVMAFPVLVQLLLIMFIAVRASQLLMNPQLHLIGVHKEIFINCLVACLLFVVFIYDPKNADNLFNAKLIMFAIFSTSCFWLIWIYSLKILSMFIVAIMFLIAIGISFIVGVKVAFSAFDISIWMYFAFWLTRSPLQRQFKFENFSGLVDYFVERLRLTSIKRLITTVNNKNHALLMGEGDGYINRIFMAQIFSSVFTLFYVIAMRNLRDLCLWMILLLLLGVKARIKVMQSQAKLWLLNDGDRLAQFNITENIMLRLNIYPVIVALMLLMLWSSINPELMTHALRALFAVMLFVIALDYCSGFVVQGAKYSLLVFMLFKMGFMSAMVFIPFNFLGYVTLVAALLGVCV
ncbi:MAG: hypothetical protein EOO07_21710, partial [Chitinophagaceae bacterium]